MKREERGVEDVANLVRQLPQAFHFLARSRVGRDARVLGDRFGNGGIQAAIQGMKLPVCDRRALLDGELGNGLADVAVVVHHLRDVESQGAEIAAMARGGGGDGIGRKWYERRFGTKRL